MLGIGRFEKMSLVSCVRPSPYSVQVALAWAVPTRYELTTFVLVVNVPVCVMLPVMVWLPYVVQLPDHVRDPLSDG